MAFTDLARAISAFAAARNHACQVADLSWRSIFTLDLLRNRAEGLDNQALQDELVLSGITTEASAKKDASAAKGELLDRQFITIGRRVSEFTISEEGRSILAKVDTALSESGFSTENLAILAAEFNRRPVARESAVTKARSRAS